MTIFGASGHCIRPVYMMASGTTKEAFLDFLKLLKAEVGSQKVDVILDNHGAHDSTMCKDFAAQNDLQLRFIPRYSCMFNSQERVWAGVKREFSRLLSIERDIINEEKMKELIWKACHSTVVTADMINSNEAAVRKTLSF